MELQLLKKTLTTHRPYGVVEKGVALNYTFITKRGKLMWRKAGVSHGTRNKIYTKKVVNFIHFGSKILLCKYSFI